MIARTSFATSSCFIFDKSDLGFHNFDGGSLSGVSTVPLPRKQSHSRLVTVSLSSRASFGIFQCITRTAYSVNGGAAARVPARPSENGSLHDEALRRYFSLAERVAGHVSF